MNKSSKIAALLALAGSTQAMAGDGFFGFSAGLQIYDDGTDLWCVIDVYADFSDDGFAVLNVFNADVSSGNGGGFHHNDLADVEPEYRHRRTQDPLTQEIEETKK